MNDPPDHTAELRSGELIVVGRYHRAEIFLNQFRIVSDGRVHVHEQNTQFLEILSIAVIHDLGLVLRRHPGEEFTLCFRDTEFLVGFLDRIRNHVPILDLALCRFDVVVDIVEVDLVERAATAPLRHGLAQEALVCLEPKVEHPLRLFFHARHLADDLFVQALFGLEHIVFLGITPFRVCIRPGQYQRLPSVPRISTTWLGVIVAEEPGERGQRSNEFWWRPSFQVIATTCTNADAPARQPCPYHRCHACDRHRSRHADRSRCRRRGSSQRRRDANIHLRCIADR